MVLYFKFFLDTGRIVLYNIKQLNIELIKSGGGTGPMKPGNQYLLYGAKSCSNNADR